MQISDLKPARGSKRERRRVGRGWGSGMGKTATRGYNGQGQRSGESTKRGFEGGQMPLYRKLPKNKFFSIVNQKVWNVVNVGELNGVFKDGETVTNALALERGLGDGLHWGLRIIGNGELKVKVNVQAHHVSAGAREKIEALGGTIEILELADTRQAKDR